MRPLSTRPTRLLVLGFALVVLAGCPGGSSPPSDGELRIKNLSILFGQYINQHRGQTPADEKEFKQFIKNMPKETQDYYKIDPNNIDQAFVSPRDNQPFGIAYKSKVSATPDASGKTTPVIWEKTGSGGQHYVADGLGKIELIDDADFKKRVPNPG